MSDTRRRQHQVNVRMDDETHERIRVAAAIQAHTEGQLCRILIELTLPLYEKVRSVDALKELINGSSQ